ncbi:efflux RND transporter periplasmic adaptor subunit [Edaphobacter sp. 12200R-103]|uniref:efflux RND transporter periplasmic adaptor subunit n=1 Tax=Edaphobacter sp. 12200R-103 TaxID=2703788 RepID=UPI00138D3FC0|nr:efflux RND transporter periplasmic adaptor subunit [Edaphobacter sp. 12200R-103]QHS50980.1 efflux RND transporter periplasmic adaptor subunit [Edaphobacter sp. 12200R-103]
MTTSKAQDVVQSSGATAPIEKQPLELVIANPQELNTVPVPAGHRNRIWLAVFALIALAAAGFVLKRHFYRPKTMGFETAKLERGPIQAFITATGNLNPVVNVQVGSQVSGNIKALYADFNTKVQKGQLIAQIDPAIFQAQVDAASAAVNGNEASVASADAQLMKADSDIAAATATRTSLVAIAQKDQANLLNIKEQWRRSEGLFQEGVVSSQDHDMAKAAFAAAQAQLESDKAQIDAASRNIQSFQAQSVSVRAQLGGAIAQLQQAKANLAQAQVNLDHTRIIAPVSGTVIARHFDVGQTVAATFQTPDLFDIGEDLTKMQVDTNVDEADVGSIHSGQLATFTVDAYPETTFHGTVADVRRAPINAQNVVTYDVVITVPNPDLKLFPGMTAKVTILTLREENALKVPNAALRFRPNAEVLAKLKMKPAEGSQVYLLSGTNISSVPVTTSISDGRFTGVISSTLKEGDTVILRSVTPNTSPSLPSTRRLPGT